MRNHSDYISRRTLIAEKVRESAVSVLPIVLIVLLLCLTITPVPMTVLFILALGVGVANIRSDGNAEAGAILFSLPVSALAKNKKKP